MRLSLVYFLFTSQLLAQATRPAPQQAPIDALMQSYQSAFSQGKYDEAAMNRDQARALLSQIPADDPQFANWAQRVSQIYDSGGLAAQARDVLEQALGRSASLGESSPARIALLDAVSRSWEEDRNLLKAVSYLEQAVAASEAGQVSSAQPPRRAQAAPSASPWFGSVTGVISSAPMPNRVVVFQNGYSGSNNNAGLYQQLFNLYRRLGRPQDTAAVLARITAHVKNSDGVLASLYEQQGEIDEAVAIYKREAAQAADPQQAAIALRELANVYQSTQRYGDAAAALQQAIGKMDVSGAPGSQVQSLGMRQYLANVLQQGGQVQAADEVYQQLMAQASTGQPNQQRGIVDGYANFLAQINRTDRAETLLNDYQASHSGLEPWEQNSLMLTWANVETAAGKPELAEEYRRRASASQPQFKPPVGESRIEETLQHARDAANTGKLDEAFNLIVQALDAAPGAVDREAAPGVAFDVAATLATQKAAAKADEIFRRTFALVESWSAATVSPLLLTQQNYARILHNQQRWSEFEPAVERYSGALTAAHGSGTGWQEDVLRLRAEACYWPERRSDALAASQELVKLEESLSGTTSEPYLHAAETFANAIESGGDPAGAVPLRRKIVTIADLVYTANDARRATVRINAAMAFASVKQFDEAERLAAEAVAIGQHSQPPLPGAFTGQMQLILQMKQAALAASAPKQ